MYVKQVGRRNVCENGPDVDEKANECVSAGEVKFFESSIFSWGITNGWNSLCCGRNFKNEKLFHNFFRYRCASSCPDEDSVCVLLLRSQKPSLDQELELTPSACANLEVIPSVVANTKISVVAFAIAVRLNVSAEHAHHTDVVVMRHQTWSQIGT